MTDYNLTSVQGRYPSQRAAVLRSENVEAAITSFDDGSMQIRLDDRQYTDMWIELVVSPTSEGVEAATYRRNDAI